MVFNLKPPDITLDFERRKYRLGDTINATVTLIPNGNIRVRKASLNLMALVRRTKVKMGRTMGFTLGLEDGASTIREGVPQRTNDYLPMQRHTDRKVTTEVFYSTPIALTESLLAGIVCSHKVALKLDLHSPRLRELAMEANELQWDANRGLTIEPWWLEAQVDVVRGRDAVARRRIEIIAPLKITT